MKESATMRDGIDGWPPVVIPRSPGDRFTTSGRPCPHGSGVEPPVIGCTYSDTHHEMKVHDIYSPIKNGDE